MLWAIFILIRIKHYIHVNTLIIGVGLNWFAKCKQGFIFHHMKISTDKSPNNNNNIYVCMCRYLKGSLKET